MTPFGAGLYDAGRAVAELPAPSRGRQHRLRQPGRPRPLGAGRGRARPRLGRRASTSLLSARRVGPTGRAYGVDMTAEMLELARANQAARRRHQRRVPGGPHRGRPAPGRQRRRGRVELRDQPVRRQAGGVRRGLPGAAPRRSAGRRRRRRRPGARARAAGRPRRAWAACIAGAVTRDRYRTLHSTRGSSTSRSSTATPWPRPSGRCSSGPEPPYAT